MACDICGRATSALDKPFTRTTLLMHQAKCHRENSATGGPLVKRAGNGDGALRCDLCGATADHKGRAFQDRASLKRHRCAAHRRLAPAPVMPGEGVIGTPVVRGGHSLAYAIRHIAR